MTPFHQATVGRGTGARTQTDGLKGRRAAVTACPRNGATRECRTPSRCVQGSYAPERWWRGDQPWDRTTFSRASAERYDHTSSLVAGVEPTAGVEPAPARYEGAVPPATLRRRWSRLEDSNPDSPVIGRTSCLLDEAWVGPAGWSRTSLVPLKRRAHGRSATTGYGEMKVGCRAGIRTRIFPVNSRTCCRCHHPTSENEWSGREDSNLHAPAPEAGGLPITLRPEERVGVSGRSRTG